MAEEESAGRLYADVLADVSKFRADAQRKLKAELAQLEAEAKVKAAFARTQVRTALNTTLREVAADAKTKPVQVAVSFDRAQVRRALNDAMREVARDERLNAVKARVDFDRTQIRRALSAALKTAMSDIEAGLKLTPLRMPVQVDSFKAQREIDALASRQPVVKIDTEAQTATFENQVDGARRRQSSRPVNIPVRADTATLARFTSALTRMSMMPVIADGAFQLAGGLVAVASAAGQAVGVLAALPNVAGVAAQGLGALLLGFSGIGDAVKAMGQAQQAAGTQATKSAASQQAAAERVRSAQERLARAQEQAAERVAQARQRLTRTAEEAAERSAAAEQRLAQVQADGARRVEDAERAVTAAHVERRRALEGLRAATEAAIEKQEDLTLALSGAALDEESAELALERARIRLEQITGAGSTASELDKREADLAFRQAIQRLEEVRERNGDLAKEKAESDRKGIAGSDEVVAAQQRVVEAARAEREALRELAETRTDVARDVADAQRDLAKTQRDNARDIADAQADIARAQRDGARDVADAQRELARALRPATSAATGQAAAITALNTALAKLSPEGRKFAKFVKETLEPRFRQLRNAVQAALLPHIQKAITLGMPLLDTLQKGLVGTANRVGGLAEKLGALFGSKAFNTDVSKIMASNNRALSDFGDAGIALVKILTRVAKVAGPILLEPFAAWIKQLAEAAEKSDKLSESRIARFLEKSAESAKKLGKIFGNVVRGLGNIARAARPAGDTLIDDLVTASERFEKWTGDPTNQQRIKDFFDRMVPVMEKLGSALNRVVSLLLRLQEIGGGTAFKAFLSTLEAIAWALEKLISIPGVGPVVTALLTLAGVGLALGLVGAAIGGIAKNLGRLAKFTGLSKLLGGIAGGFKKMGDEAEKELPKDKKKSDALKDVGDKAKDTKTKSDDLGKGFDDLGDRAAKGAKRSRGLAGALKKVGDRAKDTGSLLGGLFSPSTGKHGKKGGKGAAVGKGAAGAVGLGALLFGDDIMAALGIDPESIGGKAASGAISGGSFGSFLGPIGTALGSIFGAAFGTVEGGGGDVGKAGIGSLLGLPGLFLGGFHDKIMGELKKLAVDVQPQVKKIKGFFSSLPTEISGFFSSAWSRAKQTVPALGKIEPLVKSTLGKVRTGFSDLRNRAPEILRNAWSTAVNTVPGLKPLVTTVGGVVNGARERFSDLKARAPQILSDGWRGALNTIPGLKPLTQRIGEVIEGGRKRFDDLRTKAPQLLSAGWKGVLGTIPGLKPLTGKVKEITDGVVGWFKSGVGGVKSNWDKIPGITSGPIRTVANKVYNNGLVTIWNSIASKIPGFSRIDPIKLNFARGGILPGYTPGRDVHTFLSPTGGMLGLSGGEAILRPELTRVLGGGFVHGGNQAARSGGTRGVMRWLEDFFGGGQRFATGGIFEGVGNFLSSVKNFFTGGLKKALTGGFGPIMTSVTGSLSGSPYGKMIAAVAQMFVSKAIAHIMGFEDHLVGGDTKGVVAAAKKYVGVGDDRGANSNMFNRKWGYAPGTPWCFAADTLIRTPTGWTPIQNVVPGTEIVTPSGQVTTTTALLSRNKPLLRLRALGIPGTHVTRDHPYWARRGKHGTPEWIKAGDLSRNDMISIPLREQGTENFDPELATLLGVYTADGHRLHRDKGIQISESRDKAEAVAQACKAAGLTPHITQNRTCAQITVYDRRAYEMCAAFGDGAEDKQVPGMVLRWGRQAREAYLAGYVSGDGCYDSSNGYQVTTVSYRLAISLGELLRSLGFYPNITLVRPAGVMKIEGREVTTRDTYNIKWKPWPLDRRHVQFYVENDLLWVPVRSVEETGRHEKVYDLTVPGEHAFIADGAAVHNCANFVSTAIQDAKAGKWYKGYPTAAVYGYWGRMKKVATSAAKPGDLGVYGGPTGHINIVEKGWNGRTFQTIGGNENSLVRRATRSSAFDILRPSYARGGVIDRKVFREKNEGYDHDRDDPLYRLLSRLTPSVAMRVSDALAKVSWLNRDSGGPLHPGVNLVHNGTGQNEWVLTPQAVAMLGGPAAVQSLNVAARLHRSARASSATDVMERHERPITQNIYPQKGQSEYEIGMVAARKIGAMLRR